MPTVYRGGLTVYAVYSAYGAYRGIDCGCHVKNGHEIKKRGCRYTFTFSGCVFSLPAIVKPSHVLFPIAKFAIMGYI